MTDITERVSVIVPVYNDPVGVRQTLQAIDSQLGVIYEVLVVDNNSTDETPKTIRTYADEKTNVTLLVEDKVQGSYAARNMGIEHATGDVLAFLDADESVDEDWLATAVKSMDEQDVEYLGCAVELYLEEESVVGRYNARTGFPVERYLKKECYAPTCALLVRRKVIEDVGPFDARLISGGDLEFGQRVAAAGYDQGYTENAVVTHPARTTFQSLAKKNFRVGRGFCQLQRYYPDRYGKPGIPPRPSGPGDDEDEFDPETITNRVLFTFLSIALLVCRGLGYYYEFFFRPNRDD